MNVALCAIGRLENRYAVEFVDYYKNLGVDKIFISDNNYNEEEYFEDVLQPYIDENFVEIIDCRNKEVYQNTSYNEIYSKYHWQYDYMIFVDFDEYICLTEDSNIKEYLARNSKGYDVILLNWMIYTDNDLVIDDGRPLNERFTTPMTYNKKISFGDICENDHVKCIVYCKKYSDIHFSIPHFPISLAGGLTYCNNKFEDAEPINGDLTFCKYDFTLAYVKHFCTKTIDEYLNIKLKRGTPDRIYSIFQQKYNTDWFFEINNRTPEKERFIKEFYINNENLY